MRQVAALRRSGGRWLARKAARRVWGSWSTIVAECELGERPSRVERDRLVVRPVPLDGFAEFDRLMRAADGADFLFLRGLERTRRARAADLFGGYAASDGRLLTTMWVHRPCHAELLERIAPAMYRAPLPGEVLTEGLYCRPAARGAGYGAETLDAVLAQLEEEGVRRAFAHIDADNRSSMATFGRVGYRPSSEERLNAYRLGIWRPAFLPLSPSSRASWDASQRAGAPSDPVDRPAPAVMEGRRR